MASPHGRVLEHARAWREHRWLTQQRLAELAGLSIFTVQQAERGKPVSGRTVRELARALGISPDELCQDTPQQAAV